jgi:hypothetical protein
MMVHLELNEMSSCSGHLPVALAPDEKTRKKSTLLSVSCQCQWVSPSE